MAVTVLDVIDATTDRRATVAHLLHDGALPPTTVLSEPACSGEFGRLPVVDLIEVYLQGRRQVPMKIILRALHLTTVTTVADLTEVQRARLCHLLSYWPA